MWSQHPGERVFLDTVREKFLEQMVDFATHQSGSTLDLVFTDQPDKINNTYPLGPLGNGDHTMVMVEYTAGTDMQEREETTVPNWKKLNMSGLKSDISNTNWDEILGNFEGELLWEKFKSKFDEIILKICQGKKSK